MANFNDPFDLAEKDLAAITAVVASWDEKKNKGDLITGDEVDFRTDGKHKITLPQNATYSWAIDTLERMKRDQESEVTLLHIFKYRPNDGAVAAARVIKREFGISFGEAQRSMFGTTPPQLRSVPISATESVDVPWGELSLPGLDGVRLHLASTHDDEYGNVFAMSALLPKKHTKVVKDLYNKIEAELKTNSIYRGKSIVGTSDPQFLDLSGFDPKSIVLAEDVEHVLDGTLWTVLKHRDVAKREGIKTKRCILVSGDYGTGKTSVLMLTATIANANGWTYIQARAGRDNVNETLKLARLYQPAVVGFEDIDTESTTGEPQEVSQLLETFDGITAKGGELCVIMTTNHQDKIIKGMLRPGRLDGIVTMGALDRPGVERLTKIVVPEGKLDPDVDWGAVFTAVEQFSPAFVYETLERAKSFAIGHLHGETGYVLTTKDIVGAADSLRPQLEAMLAANEGETTPTLDAALNDTVQGALHHAKIVDSDYDSVDMAAKQGSSAYTVVVPQRISAE